MAHIVWALAVLALLSACGSASGSGSTADGAPSPAASTATSAPGAPAPDSCAPGTRTLCVMADDDGRTITVRVGQSLTLELKARGRSFGEPTESGAKVLERIGASRSGSAAEAYYRAVGPGRVQLRALERPLCGRGRACPQFIELWQIQVRVVR